VTEQLEQELRRLFAEDAEKAPTSVPVLETAHRRSHRRWNTPLVWGAGALVAASVAGVALLGGAGRSDSPSDPAPVAAAPSSTPTATPSEQAETDELSAGSAAAAATRTGALPLDPPLALCKRSSPEFVARLDVAFDGTVTAIGATRPKRPGRDTAQIVTTFAVNEWFRGGTAATVTVDMPMPHWQVSAPAFEVGTRLLVSGTRPYVPKNYSVHVWGCGYTRYYDEATADGWREAFR
jgi:hypothetical protein